MGALERRLSGAASANSSNVTVGALDNVDSLLKGTVQRWTPVSLTPCQTTGPETWMGVGWEVLACMGRWGGGTSWLPIKNRAKWSEPKKWFVTRAHCRLPDCSNSGAKDSRIMKQQNKIPSKWLIFLSHGLNKQKMLKANYNLWVFMSYIRDIELLIDERMTKRPLNC